MDLKEMGLDTGDWIDLAQDIDKCWAYLER